MDNYSSPSLYIYGVTLISHVHTTVVALLTVYTPLGRNDWGCHVWSSWLGGYINAQARLQGLKISCFAVFYMDDLNCMDGWHWQELGNIFEKGAQIGPAKLLCISREADPVWILYHAPSMQVALWNFGALWEKVKVLISGQHDLQEGHSWRHAGPRLKTIESPESRRWTTWARPPWSRWEEYQASSDGWNNWPGKPVSQWIMSICSPGHYLLVNNVPPKWILSFLLVMLFTSE